MDLKCIEAMLKLVKCDVVATSRFLVSFFHFLLQINTFPQFFCLFVLCWFFFFGVRKFQLVVFNFVIILGITWESLKKKRNRTKLSPVAFYWSDMHLGYWNFSQLLGNSPVQPNLRAHLHYKGEIQVCALCKSIRCNTALCTRFRIQEMQTYQS